MEIQYRGAVTFKSLVGTNVAFDALSNLSSAGVMARSRASWEGPTPN
jgi:TPP-dependent indolepyruvate ferredoxin oxidoreductase alpha subunit